MYLFAFVSRKRGPVFGAGFVAVDSDEQLELFLALVPSKVPFLEGIQICVVSWPSIKSSLATASR